MTEDARSRKVQPMAQTALTPVFVGLRTGLHVLFASLVLVVIARAWFGPTDRPNLVVALSVVLLATYAAGLFFVSLAMTHGRLLRAIWLGVLTAEWMGLLWLIPDAAYLVFPLFFLYLHLLGQWWGAAAITTSTVVAVFGLALHGGWSVGGVVGPIVGAGVALLIGLGYQALAREAEQREALMMELLNTRGRLAATERQAGVLAERGRLAREIHDTVAQGLSSIQMLLHAVERADPERRGVEHIRLARETAAANLADARRFIRELTPPELDDQGLGGALRRLAHTQWTLQGLNVTVRVSDSVVLPMHVESALLRIAQGAIANVIQHAHATAATIDLSMDRSGLRFTIADDGTGFNPLLDTKNEAGKSDSFGLQAMRERVQQLGGALTIDSAVGRGTLLTVELSVDEEAT